MFVHGDKKNNTKRKGHSCNTTISSNKYTNLHSSSILCYCGLAKALFQFLVAYNISLAIIIFTLYPRPLVNQQLNNILIPTLSSPR